MNDVFVRRPVFVQPGFEGIEAGGAATTEGGSAFQSLITRTLKTFRRARDGPGFQQLPLMSAGVTSKQNITQ